MKSFRRYVEGEKAPKFNRLKHYLQYYKDVSPVDFKIKIVDGKIQIELSRIRSRER